MEEDLNVVHPDREPEGKTEEKPKESTNTKINPPVSEKHKKIKRYSILGIIIAVILIIIFFPRDNWSFSDSVLPYIPTKQLDSAFDFYLNNYEPNEIICAYGPHGYGKTRSIMNSIKRNSHLVRPYIKLDFSILNLYSGEKDILNLLRNGIYYGLRNADGKVPANFLKIVATQIEPLVVVSAQNLTQTRAFKDNSLNRIYQSFASLIESIPTNASYSIASILKGLSYFAPSHTFCIIVNQPQNLDLINSDLFTIFTTEASKIRSGIYRIGIIVETTDTKWLFNDIMIRTEPHYSDFLRLISTQEFALESAKNLLTAEFRQSQISELFSLFGGKGDDFANVHELMRQGFSFTESISEQQSKYSKIVKELPENITLSSIFPATKVTVEENTDLEKLYDLGIVYYTSTKKLSLAANGFVTAALERVKGNQN